MLKIQGRNPDRDGSGGNSIRVDQRYAVREDLCGIIDARPCPKHQEPFDSLRKAVSSGGIIRIGR